MAPLSKALAGIMLPHDHYGNHLDSQGQTIDTELEKTNFSYAGIALAEVWSEMTIDGHFTSRVSFPFDTLNQKLRHRQFYNNYQRFQLVQSTRQSQYLLQILKCSDQKCCNEKRSSSSCHRTVYQLRCL
ncbi:hypothetical protein Bhyg_07831 [Pseudolycoriella hygida]|uniref:Uncharacterized protein n=1 Tax=Pseudolycoriella hygida TaxID=35572 RepID=A0A9Q0N3H8_9DIPT|nr:hypothetical protein Bhyg_07831 [Pseudolycoriella hygida]